ncbi:MAG: nucleoside-diphosphate kinase, partial [Opitutales bacterium]|nr:nucleoside-diphosphate kinase [Opitutales bacterium]
MQKTLIILKPDCMEKNLAGTVLSRFEAAGLTLVACKMIQITETLVRDHYAHLVNEPFFGLLSDWMM